MKQRWTAALRIALALALIAAIAVIPAVAPSSCMMEAAEGKSLRVNGTGEFAPHRGALGVPVADSEPESALEPVPVADAAVSRKEPASPPAGGEAEVPAADPVDPPAIARIDPLLASPSNLFGTYYPQGWGNSRNELEWTQATDPTVTRYLLEEWTSDDFASMVSIFNQLVVYESSAATPAADFQAHTTQAMQAGLTIAEREDIADLIEVDLDWLLSIISGSTEPEVWDLWDDLVALSPLYEIDAKKNTYQRNKLDLNIYYFYVVVAEYPSLNTSPPTNSWGMFAYDKRSTAPAQPTGFTATAYDPGVALEWNRNLEMDLVGYNVYLLDGVTEILLNTGGPITHGTEFFHMDGLVGATYLVRAINSNDVLSTAASAVSVLAAATVYDADSTAWVYSGSWAREDYSTSEPSGGALLRVGHWGEVPASDPPYDPAPPPGTFTRASVSLQFNGRRIRVYSARFFRCGSVNFYIDGNLEGTFNLYYDGGYYDGPYGTGTYVPALWQQMSFQITGLSSGNHTLIIEAVGSGGAQGSQFINFEYAESRGP